VLQAGVTPVPRSPAFKPPRQPPIPCRLRRFVDEVRRTLSDPPIAGRCGPAISLDFPPAVSDYRFCKQRFHPLCRRGAVRCRLP